MITGSQPDPNRDYNLDKELPACMETFAHQHDVLMALAGRLYEMTGSRGSAYAQLQKAAIQLESFVEDSRLHPRAYGLPSARISAISASWMLSVDRTVRCCYDYLSRLSTADTAAPRGESPFRWGTKLSWFEPARTLSYFLRKYTYNRRVRGRNGKNDDA